MPRYLVEREFPDVLDIPMNEDGADACRKFIERNAGEGTAFFQLNARISRAFRFNDRWQFEALAEGFNLTNRANVVTRNTNFGPGAYPTNPLPTFNQITAVGEARSFQIGGRIRF